MAKSAFHLVHYVGSINRAIYIYTFPHLMYIPYCQYEHCYSDLAWINMIFGRMSE